MAMVSLGVAPAFLVRAAAAGQFAAAGSGRPLLVAIFQRGAVDGLNMVVPHAEGAYYTARPSIAIAPPGAADGVIDLDGTFGLHPRLAPLVGLWSNKSLAVVHACGSHDPTRSHFDAQDFMESATPGDRTTQDGWLNRYLQAGLVADPLRGVAVTPTMPRALSGTGAALSMKAISQFDLFGDLGAVQALKAAYLQSPDDLFRQTSAEAFAAVDDLAAIIGAAYQPAGGAIYPESPLGWALRYIARLAKSGIGLEVAFAEATDWDHHVNEGGATGALADRLDDLARAIAALAADLGPRMADTVVLTMSEFGRTVAENGNGGTDHGHGNAMLVAGGPVRGGQVYGAWPGLAPASLYQGRDLAVTTDFREVFAEVLTGHLGLGAGWLGQVLPGFSPSAPPGLLGG
jgi:uncharacterized protein (DUF1501 family)